MANSTTRRPCFPTASATANGKLPPPQITASGLFSTSCAPAASLMPSSRVLPGLPTGVPISFRANSRAPRRHGQRPRAGADERDHLGDQRVAAAVRGEAVQALAERPGTEEQRLVGLSQPVNIRPRDA